MTKAAYPLLDRLSTDPTFETLFWPILRREVGECNVALYAKYRMKSHRPYMMCLTKTLRVGLSTETQNSLLNALVEGAGIPLKVFLEKNPDEELKKAATGALVEIGLILGIATALVNYPKEEEGLHAFRVQHREFMLQHAAGETKKLFESFQEALSKGDAAALEKVKSDARQKFQTRLLALIKMSETVPLVTEVDMDYQGAVKDEEKIRDITRFTYDGPKTKGNEIGILARKKVKEEDSPHKEKYKHRWMVKKQTPSDSVMEKLTADISRWFAVDAFPKIHLLRNGNGDGVYLASRFIDGFEDGWDAFPGLHGGDDIKAYDKAALHDAIYTQVPGMEWPWAINVLNGNFDIHARNVGQTPQGAAVVDLAKGLHFRVGYDVFTRDPRQIPGMKGLKVGDDFMPVDMLRSLHGGFYQINSSLFLNEGYITALEGVVARIEAEPEKFQHAIRSSVRCVQRVFATLGEDEQESLDIELKRISPDATLDNLHEVLPRVMMERKDRVKELSLHMRLQMELGKNNVPGVRKLLEKNPGLRNTLVKWLTEENRVSQYHPAATVVEFAESRKESLSPEMRELLGIEVKREVEALQETRPVIQATRHGLIEKLKGWWTNHFTKEGRDAAFANKLFSQGRRSHVASFRYNRESHIIRLRFDSDKVRNKAEQRLRETYPDAEIKPARTDTPKQPLLFIKIDKSHVLDALAQEVARTSGREAALPAPLLHGSRETTAYFKPNKALGVESSRYNAEKSRVTLQFTTREQRAEAKRFFEECHPKATLVEKRKSSHHKPLLQIEGEPYVNLLAERVTAVQHKPSHVEKLQCRRETVRDKGKPISPIVSRGAEHRSILPGAIATKKALGQSGDLSL